MNKIRSTLAVALVLTVAGVAAAAAVSASAPPQLSAMSVQSVQMNPIGLRLTIAGHLTCTLDGHLHINIWVIERSTGAMVKASLPPPLGSKPKPAALAAQHAISHCTGASQPWSLSARAAGTHPTGFAPGPANACTVVTVSKSSRYDLRSTCTQVRIA